MIKTILVPATGGAADSRTFATAAAIARSFLAHIDAVHVRYDPVEIAVATAAGDGTAAGGPIMHQLIDQLEEDAHKREGETYRLFESFCAREHLRVAATPAPQ